MGRSILDDFGPNGISGRGLISRRRFLRGLAGVGAAIPLAALLAACGGDDDDDDDAPTSTPDASDDADPTAATAGEAEPTATESEAGSSDAFPVTIEHKFGETVIEAEPQRVVTIGFSEQDAVLALGVKPVAVREWFGEQPFAVWPWAQDELGDAEPEVLVMPFGELDYELIAGLEPDLIIGTHSGILVEEYDFLTQIAPTLAQPDTYPDFGVPWQEQTRLIGRALGREAQAEELVTSVEEGIAAAGAEHPEFDGATVAWITPSDSGFNATGPTTPPMRFLADLGFQMPDDLADAIGDLDSIQISGEQLGLIDVDVLIAYASSEEFEALIASDPLFQRLDVLQEGRIILFESLSDPIYGALSFSTVLSLPYAVEELTSRLVAAVDGDPETEAAASESGAREVEDAVGPVTLPANPQRVIADNNTTLGNMLALGVKPVGTGVNVNSLPTYLADQMEGIVNLVAEGGIDIEQALTLDPDLMIAIAGSAGETWNLENCERYKAALTTFCYDQSYVYEEDIKANVRQIALALGIEEKADEVIAEFDARVADLRAKVEEAGFTDKPITVVRVFDDGTYSIRIGTSESIIFRAVGIPQPEGQQNPEDFSIDLSMERLNVLNEAYVVVVYIDDNSSTTQDDILDSELWQTVTAVQEDRVVFVNSGIWNSIDILGAHRIMDDIEELILPLAQEEQ